MPKRAIPEINSGSMADIAFLLLIFFLVATTIDQDKGILRKLPPMPDENNPPQEVKANMRNVLFVWVNQNDDLLVKGEPSKIEDLRSTVKAFVDNNGRNPDFSDSPQDAIVSLKNDIGTSYKMYIAVQNEVAAAFRELRDQYSMQLYGKNFADLTKDAEDEKVKSVAAKKKERVKKVKQAYPMRVSEAEPNISESVN
ncbi:MAG: biopolymer transporter ExbD [Bacteroidia bacterium]